MAGEKLADASIERLISSSRLGGLIGERQELVSGRGKPLVREPTDSSSGQAESCGDSRLSMGGNADRKSPARQKINLESRAEEEAFTLNFYRRGREGERSDDFGERRERGLHIFDPCQFCVQDCNICYNKQQLRNSGEEGGGVLLSCS